MKCSICSNDVRPIVVSDIDGTLADYHSHFGEFARRYHDCYPYDIYQFGPWEGSGEFEDYLGLSKEEYREAKLAYRQGGNKRFLKPYPRAVDFLQEMKSCGAEIWVCTTRPYQRLDNIDPDTREWLHRNDVPYDGLLYGEDKYERLVSIIDPDRIVLVVDDLTTMIQRAMSVDLPTFQIHRPHNLAHRLGEGGSMIAAIQRGRINIDKWKAHHDNG